MSTEATLQTAQALLAPWTKGARAPEPDRLDVLIDAADLTAAVQALHDARWGYLAAITALDYLGRAVPFAQDARWQALMASGRVPADGAPLEALYFFAAGRAIVTLRMLLPREGAAIASICGILPSASFFERELSEMFGITVTETPDPNHLFLPENWPAGVHPLRKDFAPGRQ